MVLLNLVQNRFERPYAANYCPQLVLIPIIAGYIHPQCSCSAVVTPGRRTFLTLIVNAFLRCICCVVLLMVQVLFRVVPGVISSKSKDANWPGRQKSALCAGSCGSSNSNVITSRDSCLMLMQRSLVTPDACNNAEFVTHDSGFLQAETRHLAFDFRGLCHARGAQVV